MAEADSNGGRSSGIIIGVVVVAVLGMLCCGCLALAWVLGDFVVEIVEQFATSLILSSIFVAEGL